MALTTDFEARHGRTSSPSTLAIGATPSSVRSTGPGYVDARGDIIALQQKIAARISHGGSLADVRREVINPSALSEDQRAALWLYAASQPAILQAARPLARRLARLP